MCFIKKTIFDESRQGINNKKLVFFINGVTLTVFFLKVDNM